MCLLLLFVTSFSIIGGKLDTHWARFGKKYLPRNFFLYLIYHKPFYASDEF